MTGGGEDVFYAGHIDFSASEGIISLDGSLDSMWFIRAALYLLF